MDADDWAMFEVDGNVQDVINAQYTQQCIIKRGHNQLHQLLEPLMLSPKTYSVEKKRIGGPVEPHLGCCKECYDQLKKVYDGGDPDKPKFAIANNKCFGYPPDELTCLNETELALVSQARVNRHMVNFTGGAHQCIKGWHNLYYNDLN